MFCKNCGSEIDEKAYVCPHCGVKTEQKQEVKDNDSGSKVGWGILSFFIPLVGLILFLVWKNDRPHTAKVCGICALVATIISVVYFVVVIGIVGSVISSVPYYY